MSLCGKFLEVLETSVFMKWVYGICDVSLQILLKDMPLKNAQIYFHTPPHPSKLAVGPTQRPVQWVLVFMGSKQLACDIDPPPQLVLWLKGTADTSQVFMGSSRVDFILTDSHIQYCIILFKDITDMLHVLAV
jgi:hypothetical protein